MLYCIGQIFCTRCLKRKLGRNSLSVRQFPACWYGTVNLNRCPRLTAYRIRFNFVSLLILVNDLKRLIIGSIGNRNCRINGVGTYFINRCYLTILKAFTGTGWVISSLSCWCIFLKTSLGRISILPVSVCQMIIKEVLGNASLKPHALWFSLARSIRQLKNNFARYSLCIVVL